MRKGVAESVYFRKDNLRVNGPQSTVDSLSTVDSFKLHGGVYV